MVLFKKNILSILVVSTFLTYALYRYSPSEEEVVNSIEKSTEVYANTTRGSFAKDGTFTGPAIDAYYGTLQVAAVIKNGFLVDVEILSYADEQDRSRQVNQSALPILKQEAIKVQSANVDAVSGASYTSPAFVESLTSALAQAK